jgi:protein-tyrosine phosphatase
MTELAGPLRVLFVCTGNICRSAIAEQAFRARYSGDDIEFTSAGVGALVGRGMPEQAAEISRQLGGAPGEHVARQITKEMIADSDLVIALSREHRSEIVRTHPRSNRYTFTLREFARVLESYAGDAQAAPIPRTASAAVNVLRGAIPIIASQRGFAEQPSSPEDDDVIDPYRRDQEIYDRSGREISDAVDRIAGVIAHLRAPRGAHAAPVDPI